MYTHAYLLLSDHFEDEFSPQSPWFFLFLWHGFLLSVNTGLVRTHCFPLNEKETKYNTGLGTD